jgi:hypothetical protein
MQVIDGKEDVLKVLKVAKSDKAKAPGVSEAKQNARSQWPILFIKPESGQCPKPAVLGSSKGFRSVIAFKYGFI